MNVERTTARVPYDPPGDLSDVAIDLELTSVCDAVCTFCPREVMPDRKRFISLEVVDRLAADLREHRPVVVVLCGIGESLLHPQVDRIVATLAGTGTRIEMTTHGAKMTPDRFERLAGLGLAGVHFSLNAMTADTRRRVMKLKDFDKTMTNVQSVLELRRRGYSHVDVHVSFVVCEANMREVQAFVEFWRPRGVSQIWLHPLNNRNGLLSSDARPVDIRPFAEEYAGDPLVLVDIFGGLDQQESLCKIARQMIFISADGEMRLCAMDYRRVTSYGNLLRETLTDMHRDKLRRYVSGEMQAFCSGCDFCPSGSRGKQLEVVS